MNDRRLKGALGLCKKAGKCASGAEACEKAAKNLRAKLLLLDCELSESSREQWQALCARCGLPWLFLREPGAAIGKPGHKVIAILDQNFAEMIQHIENIEK